ncbi:MAG TPA: tetraacyldisaccharide 4'-kinase [Blastocatellia bacterium]|nr:tetraacyldisaccharide 4'-kinase [Blastocatellia bacterium]
MTARSRMAILAGRVIGGPGETSRAARWLRPLALVHEFASHVRSTAYETGYLKSTRLPRPVISVGNITMGGTGKTPIVAMLAEFLRDQNFRVAILTRGYGRSSDERVVLRSGDGSLASDAADRAGDEPALLSRDVPRVSVIVDSDRVSAGMWAVENEDPDVFLLDDGFQHLAIGRDLNLLVLDATDPFGGGYLAPGGRLREPLQAIRRADAVIVTRCDRSFDSDAISRVVDAARSAETPIYYSYHDITGLRPLTPGHGTRTVASLRGKKVGVLTAIGNPGVFAEDLENVGLVVASRSLHADHHSFRQQDFDTAARDALASGAEVLLTTEKDAVKLERLQLGAISTHAVRIGFRSEHEALIKSLCLKTILGFKASADTPPGESS